MEQLNSIQLSFRCPKAFNELKPCAAGWYCDGCHKVVHDMRGKTEQEIGEIFAANNYKMCGMFEADRIRVNTPLPKWRKLVSAAMVILGLQACTKETWPVITAKTNALASYQKNIGLVNEVFGSAEQQAEYPGGAEKFHAYLKANLKPDDSCKTGESAFYTFTVNKDGSVTAAKILRSNFSREMNLQIIKALEKSPRWKPGMQNGRILQTQFSIPIIPLPQ